MTFLYYDRQDFYRRMLDLQEKLRKSEEERIRLEERFKLLVQESQNRHDACINRLRLRYIEFLEEQRDREDRNIKLQRALDKVDSHLALMDAKSDRLNALKKHYDAYLSQVYGNYQRSTGSVTGDSGVTSQHEDRSFRKDLISQSRRHSIQSVSIPPSTPTTNFPSRVVTPTFPKYSELRFVDPIRTREANFSYSHHQPLFSTPRMSYRQPQVLSSFTPQIPEICISPSFSPTLVSRDVQTDKSSNSFFTSVDPGQISGINRISQDSTTQRSPQFLNQFPQTTPAPPFYEINQYLYTSPLPKTNGLLESSPGSRVEFQDPFELENRTNILSTSPAPNYPDYSWKYASGSRLEEKIPRFEKNIFEKHSIFDKNSIFERNHKFDKNSMYERNSRLENKNPPRFFRKFDFNTTFRRNDRPSLSTKNLLSSSRAKTSLNPFNFSPSLKSNHDVYERSRRMDSELDRYIGKIRNLHRDVDLHSPDDLDHEQNTSGDLLNVTLSDDDIDLPVENKVKEICSREERLVTLAKEENQSEISGKQIEISRVTNAADPVTQTDASVSKTRNDDFSTKEEEESAVNATDEISSKNTKRGTEIATNENINSELAKPVENSIDTFLNEKEENRAGLDESKTSVVGEVMSEGDDLTQNNEELKVEKELKKIEDNGLECGDKKIETADAEDLNINADGKKSEVEDLKTESEDLNPEDADSKKIEEDQMSRRKENDQQAVEKNVKENQNFVQNQNPDYQYGSNQDYQYDPSAGYDQYQAYPAEGYEQYNQEYDHNQQFSQDPSQYCQDAQYSEDPNQYNQDPSQYTQDPNQQYDLNQQYEQDLNQQYDPSQYSQDPNQYNQDPNQPVEQDSSQQYAQDPNQQFPQDSSQEFTQDPNQYDPSQQYQDPNVQYDPTQSYDPNQGYDYTQSQEYSQQDQSYLQQDQTYNCDQLYDQNYIPAESAVEKEDQNMEVKINEKEVDGVEPNNEKKNVINLESDTESTIERNTSNTESDFDFN